MLFPLYKHILLLAGFRNHRDRISLSTGVDREIGFVFWKRADDCRRHVTKPSTFHLWPILYLGQCSIERSFRLFTEVTHLLSRLLAEKSWEKWKTHLNARLETLWRSEKEISQSGSFMSNIPEFIYAFNWDFARFPADSQLGSLRLRLAAFYGFHYVSISI